MAAGVATRMRSEALSIPLPRRMRSEALSIPSQWDWSWSCSCGRQSVDQCVWVSGLPLGPLTRFYLALLLLVDNYVILLSMRPL
jgi:hypothetical protein